MCETFESLSEGFQNAVTELGGVPLAHRTDNLGAAVINMGADKGEMTKRYKGLLDHYGVERSKIQPGKRNQARHQSTPQGSWDILASRKCRGHAGTYYKSGR